MSFPNFELEKKLWTRGCRFITGLDEVGRGPLAGPVVVAAVCFSSPPLEPAPHLMRGGVRGDLNFSEFEKSLPTSLYKGRSPLRDSKQLTKLQREKWYGILTTDKTIKWALGIVSEKIIDEINILEATKLAMKRALENLKLQPDFLVLDGNFVLEDLPINQKSVIRGDEKVVSIAAASIIAKVTRDRMMEKYHEKFPLYGFNEHKGYGTKKHILALKTHGPCPIHRFSFDPVKKNGKHKTF